MTRVFVGLDIGGQSVKCISLSEEGNILAEVALPTPSSDGAAAVLSTVRSALELASKHGKPDAVGVGTPGGVDSRGVIVGMSANIRGWYGTDLAGEIVSMAKAPCVVRNDANLAAYGEWAARQGRSKALLFLGIGTGIGGGFVEEGRILGGCDDRAVEVGHVAVEPAGRSCACGVWGCAEAYGSALSIARVAMQLARGEDAGLGSLARAAWGLEGLSEAARSSPLAARARAQAAIDARDIYAAFREGDALAVAVDALETEVLARTVASSCALLAPDTAVFGGGMMRGAPHLPSSVRDKVSRKVFADAWNRCSFERSILSEKSGLIGAALYGASDFFGKELSVQIVGRLLAGASGRA